MKLSNFEANFFCWCSGASKLYYMREIKIEKRVIRYH